MATYFIVGGSSGIGLQISSQLSGKKHKIFATYNKNKNVSDSEYLTYHPCDVLDDKMDLDFLPGSIDGVVYCPGSINLKPIQRFDVEDFRKDYELQVVGVVKIFKQILPKLKASDHASVVLFSTVAVQSGFPFHSLVSSSKGAVEGLARSLAAELAPGIRVNCIAPSLTDTPLAAPLLGNEEKRKINGQRHPLKRIGTASDIANMAEFLLSEQSSWITGQVLHVDGGLSKLKT